MKLTEVKEFVKELRGLSQEELAKRENELKKELIELRFQAAAGQLEQTGRLKAISFVSWKLVRFQLQNASVL